MAAQKLIEKVGLTRLGIYIVLILGLIVPVYAPLGLPFEIAESTYGWYNFIEEELEQDDVVLVKFGGMPPALYGTLLPGMLATFNQLYKKGVKIVLFIACPEDWMGMQALLSEKDLLWPRAGEPGYGEDWLFLSYIPGLPDIVFARMASEPLKDILPPDWTEPASGERVSSFLLWNKVKDYSVSVFDAVFAFEQAWNPGMLAMMWSVPLNYNKILWCVPAEAAPKVLVYIPFNFAAVLAGMRGGAEYEKLLGIGGTGVQGLDVASVTSLVIILIIVIGNIDYFISRKKNREVEK